MRHPLRNQILLPFAALTTTAVVAVSVVGAWRAATAADRNIETHVHNAADVLLSADFPLTDAVLRQTRGLSGAEFVCTDRNGELRASSLPHDLGGLGKIAKSSIEFDDADRPPVVAAAGDTLTVADTEYLHWQVKRTPRNNVDAPLVLHVLYPKSLRKQLLREAVVPPLAVGALAALAAFALSYLLAARICRPIAAVREQFRKLAAGDYESLEPPARDDEVRDLVAAANALAKQLAERDLAVRRAARSTLLGQLSGALCHHLRNSAAGAKLAVQLHQRRCRADDAESLDVALRQLEFAEQYVQRLLTLGKPQTPHMRPLNVCEVVGEAVALVEPTLRHRGITLRQAIPASGVVVEFGDRELLRQLIVNLLLNAVDAAGERGWVEVRVDADDRVARMAVLDGGGGPSPEIAARLFEPFVTSKPDGVGLGLAACRHIAEIHRGHIQFAAAPNTCFEVTIPLRADAPSCDAADSLACEQDELVASGSSPHGELE